MFFVLFVRIEEMGRVLSSVSYQYLHFSLTHIEIFCFTHPPLLMGKFPQMGSAIPTPCTNTAVLDLSVLWDTRLIPLVIG